MSPTLSLSKKLELISNLTLQIGAMRVRLLRSSTLDNPALVSAFRSLAPIASNLR